MSAPYRIERLGIGEKAEAVAVAPSDSFSSYLSRLMKMIPTEVISLYLVGSGVIPSESAIVLVVWSIVCMAGLLIIRAWGTADPERNLPTDWVQVGISAVAFVVWLYSLGGPFAAYGLYVPYLGSLLVLAWTFFVPLLYKGPVD